MGLSFDTSFFSIICELNGALYTPEFDLTDMRISQIIQDLRSGQFENVHAILEFNPAEGWCNDVTSDVLTAAFEEETDINPEVENWPEYSRERIDGQRAGIASRVAA
ncbi:MAG: hypothetical protein K5905_17035 [Roseibium sp.]|uniref:hypothetical protein n=1 Tax=Roseibium sp. TaxID=1936156 RepID=UPI002615BB77|nr:hypothetical protein [Roseibium sp.]MCV0427168.1 hypothetical protein [Roseibium sp.]